jgi:hypothetical protein
MTAKTKRFFVGPLVAAHKLNRTGQMAALHNIRKFSFGDSLALMIAASAADAS